MAKKASSLPFLVFYGGEDFFLDRELAKARKWEGRAITLLAGEELEDHELVSICSTANTDDSLRVVIVDDAQKVKGKELESYIEEKEVTDPSVILVAIVRSEKLPAVWASVGSKGRVVERKKLKTWESNNEVIKWISDEATRIGIKLKAGVASALFDAVGADLYRLSGEVQKLAILVGKDGEADIPQLRLTVAPSPYAEPWQVAESALNKDRRKAMNQLSAVYKNQGEGANVPIVNALMKQIEKLVVARQMLDAGLVDDVIAGIVGVHPYRCRTQLLPQARKHSLTSLIGHMSRLCKLDVDVKGSSPSKRTLVELAVLAISG